MDELRKLVERLEQPHSLSMYAGPNDMALALLEERAEILAALAAIPAGGLVSDVEAMNALESLDDCARMDLGVAADGAYSILFDFILQHATTPNLGDMSRAELDAASPPLAASRAQQEPQP